MPFVHNNGVNIYYKISGQGPPLMLYHGAAIDHTFWVNNGVVEKLEDAYRLILIDARGHGQSSKLYEPEAYVHEQQALDVVAVLDDLGIQKTAFWGYSMGGDVGLALARDSVNRLQALIVGGVNPYMEPASGANAPLIELFSKGVEQGTDAVISDVKHIPGYIPEIWEEPLRNLDCRAMVAVYQSIEPEGCDYRTVISTIQIPCLIYAGDADEPNHSLLKTYAEGVSDVRFVSLPGLDHFGVFMASNAFVPQVKRFLANTKVN